jgi:sec-independent protein translocase protein TatA
MGLTYSLPIFTIQLSTMTNPILLGMLGTNEIVVILVIVLLLFGGRKIPELMRGLGKGVREFNDAKNNVKKEIEESANEVNRSVKD